MEPGAKTALGGKSATAAETEKDHRIRRLERTLGRKSLEIEILKSVVGECAAVKFELLGPTAWRLLPIVAGSANHLRPLPLLPG